MTGTITLFAILRIPVIVQRPFHATYTRRKSPLMTAARTQPARVKRVPYIAAAAEKVFRVIAIAARPIAPGVRLPTAQGTANTAVGRFFVVQLVNGVCRILRRPAFLEKREDGC